MDEKELKPEELESVGGGNDLPAAGADPEHASIQGVAGGSERLPSAGGAGMEPGMIKGVRGGNQGYLIEGYHPHFRYD